jgi:hypothetical protein
MVMLKYGFAIYEPYEMEDGTVCPITILEDMRCRMNTTDESHQPLDNEHEKGGSRAMTFVDPSMNRSGSRSTRSHHHVTGNFGVNLAFEKLPELFIFSSKAKNPQIKVDWVETLGFTRGKWGHNTYRILPPWVAARQNGSMDAPAFMQYIELVCELLCVLFLCHCKSNHYFY